MLLIGLGHKARHGKDLTARAMVRHAAAQGLHARIYGFADALKAHCRVTYGMRAKDPHLLQIVGTEVGRHSNPDLWVRVLMDTIQEQSPDVAIITDMRFPNEAAAVESAGGYLVKVSRMNADKSPWVSTDRDPQHASEIALDGFEHWHAEIKAVDGDQDGLTQLAISCFDALARIENGGQACWPEEVMS